MRYARAIGGSFEDYFKTYVEVPAGAATGSNGIFVYVPGHCYAMDVGVLQMAQGYGLVKKPEYSTVILSIQTSKQVNKKVF